MEQIAMVPVVLAIGHAPGLAALIFGPVLWISIAVVVPIGVALTYRDVRGVRTLPCRDCRDDA
jgi:hypothetical protein